ncbi:MAG: hypothetical protein OEY69_07865 [Candidatus Krumholzibacteria bacterium]|nr:hypothetical protein [Candidatus Krumholzibacteria bacterium]
MSDRQEQDLRDAYEAALRAYIHWGKRPAELRLESDLAELRGALKAADLELANYRNRNRARNRPIEAVVLEAGGTVL